MLDPLDSLGDVGEDSALSLARSDPRQSFVELESRLFDSRDAVRAVTCCTDTGVRRMLPCCDDWLRPEFGVRERRLSYAFQGDWDCSL